MNITEKNKEINFLCKVLDKACRLTFSCTAPKPLFMNNF